MLPRPKLTNGIWGAGLSFSKCHAERKAAYDPHTPYIFDGEEFSRAARFWTWGYDIYTPNRVFVVHNYKVSQSDPTHSAWFGNFADSSEGTAEDSVRRLKTLLGIPPFSDATYGPQTMKLHRSKYGLGDRRTLDQFIEFSGIDTKHQKILGNRCDTVRYVPFQEHPFGASYIPHYDNTTEAFLDVYDPSSVFFDKTPSAHEAYEAWTKKIERSFPSIANLYLRAEKNTNTLTVHTLPPAGTTAIAMKAPMTKMSLVGSVEHEIVIAHAYLHAHQTANLLLIAIAVLFALAAAALSSRSCHVGKDTRTVETSSEQTKLLLKSI